ncbi:hypothetical protein LTR29_011761 [Friedmanniomyces endolithicus]|nr:hypothetical protein LTR29_011761 [Friedmanniomyces endolithicus]
MEVELQAVSHCVKSPLESIRVSNEPPPAPDVSEEQYVVYEVPVESVTTVPFVQTAPEELADAEEEVPELIVTGKEVDTLVTDDVTELTAADD